jgi:hypothetical protein
MTVLGVMCRQQSEKKGDEGKVHQLLTIGLNYFKERSHEQVGCFK